MRKLLEPRYRSDQAYLIVWMQKILARLAGTQPAVVATAEKILELAKQAENLYAIRPAGARQRNRKLAGCVGRVSQLVASGPRGRPRTLSNETRHAPAGRMA